MSGWIRSRSPLASHLSFGPHLFWEVRQLCRLVLRLEMLREGEGFQRAEDDAVLEAFLLHLRSLVDFVWRSHDPGVRKARMDATDNGKQLLKREPFRNDALAEHFFDDPAEWEPGPLSLLLAEAYEDINWGVAHCSYSRLTVEETRGWLHAELARELILVLARFVQDAPRRRLSAEHADDLMRELEGTLARLPSPPSMKLGFSGMPAGSVATPGYAVARLPDRSA